MQPAKLSEKSSKQPESVQSKGLTNKGWALFSGRRAMDHRQLVEAKLVEVGLRLSNAELEQLASRPKTTPPPTEFAASFSKSPSMTP